MLIFNYMPAYFLIGGGGFEGLSCLVLEPFLTLFLRLLHWTETRYHIRMISKHKMVFMGHDITPPYNISTTLSGTEIFS